MCSCCFKCKEYGDWYWSKGYEVKGIWEKVIIDVVLVMMICLVILC